MTGYSPFQGWSAASPYALAMGVAAVACTVLVIPSWRRRHVAGGLYLAVLLGAAALWALLTAFELTAPSLDGKVFWFAVAYVPIEVIPLAGLLFARAYSGAVKRMDTRLLAALALFALVTVVIALTNRWHSLMWSNGSLGASGGIYGISYTPGVWFWINTVYVYALIAAASVLLLRTAFGSPRVFRGQALLVILAIIIPWAGTIVSTFVIGDRWLDVTPLSFCLMGVCLHVATVRLRLFTMPPVLVPLARARALETMTDGIVVLDMEGNLVLTNPAAQAILGDSTGDAAGRPVSELLGETFAEQATAGGQEDRRFETSLDDNGNRRHFDVACSPLSLGRGKVGSLLVLRDMTERKRMEMELATSRGQLQDAMDLTKIVNWEFDVTTGMYTVNDRLYTLYGTDAEQQGGYEMTPEEYTVRFVYPEDRNLVLEEMAKGLQSDDREYRAYVEHRIVRPDGEIRHMAVRGRAARDEDGVIIRAHGANEDITERKRTEQALAAAEEQLRQSQKMEAVGQLAGGIAHDFNNLLTAIIGNSELALGEMPHDDPNRVFVEEIKEVGDRAAELTQQILAFSRRQMLQPKVVCLNDVVGKLQPMLERVIRESIETETRLASDLELVEVDPGRMEQVLLNLAVNASDAMPDGGRLVIETANVELGESYCAVHSEVAPGRYAMLAVSDSGDGMDEQTREHIFEPFFTTKQVGKGTGLGLATVFGIVRQSGGSIAVESAPGYGTIFRVYLPMSAAAGPRAQSKTTRRETAKGSETVLVVEDEPPVRQLVVRVLRGAGYDTLEAGSGPEVVALLEKMPPIDLLLTDMVLPGGMGGKDVAAGVRAGQPGLPVIFMSGYTQDYSVFSGSGDGHSTFLEKPFPPEVLLKTVRAALDAG